MFDTVNVLAISAKGKGRIGKQLTTAFVEQRHPDKLFLAWPDRNYFRWVKCENDPDFRIIAEE